MAHNNYFQFKQFTVIQENAAMRVGTDGVLLGAWATVNAAETILDIGTGTGVIALMLAQRSTALIDAIDIEEGAIADAELNFRNSPWGERLNLFHTSLQNFQPIKKYGCIVCNPPFFNNSLPSKSEKRKLARHATSLTFPEMIKGVAERLKPSGYFSLVLPAGEETDFIAIAANTGLILNRITRVIPRPGLFPVRVLMEFGFEETDVKADELVLETGNRHEYTPEAVKLLKDFYLKL
ncbi:MAG: methyltransferase [Prolixibacteraceae bacterium]|nr:methyltransferase [Prolixibacteraceae bacterium]